MECSSKWQVRQTLVTFMQTVSKVSAATPECLFLILFFNKAAAFSNLEKSHLYLFSCIFVIDLLQSIINWYNVLQAETCYMPRNVQKTLYTNEVASQEILQQKEQHKKD